jgi:hypothetical protein
MASNNRMKVVILGEGNVEPFLIAMHLVHLFRFKQSSTFCLKKKKKKKKKLVMLKKGGLGKT